MGTCGTALYSDDLAADVRDDFKDHIAAGLSAEDATNALLEEYIPQSDMQDCWPVFWLALADTQWKTGRLTSLTKANAHEILANGSDLRRWAEDKALLESRKKVLSTLAEQLKCTPPLPKKIRKRKQNVTHYKIGEVHFFKDENGGHVFKVVDLFKDKGGTYPVVLLLDWNKNTPPNMLQICFLHPIRSNKNWSSEAISLILAGDISESDTISLRILLGCFFARTNVRQRIITRWGEDFRKTYNEVFKNDHLS